MGLRTVTLTASAPLARDPATWRRAVEDTVAKGSIALRTGRVDDFRGIVAGLAEWDDRQRAYQALRQLVELVFTAADEMSEARWIELYGITAELLLDILDVEPREPVLLNYAGVFLYELTEVGGAEALFVAAARLDSTVPYVNQNLRAVREAKHAGSRPRLRGPLAAHARGLGARARRIAGLAKPVNGLTLSLCMIVKDEEEMLPGCLAAVRDAVDEIVIVDTGSQDRTVEIAESFGARVIHFPWNGSFSDARNVGLDAATGDWLLYLDADEHVVPGDARLLRSLVGRTWREAFHVFETNYTGGDESGSAVTHTTMRIFRNRPEYRFEGRIHEQKTGKMPTYLPERFEQTRIRVTHYGYLKSRISSKDKSRRNIELLEQEAREAPSPFNSFNLGSEYLALGQPEEARKHFDQAWDEVRKLEAWQGISYVATLAPRVASARREAGDYAGARKAIAEGLEAFPQHTDLVMQAGLCARAEGDLTEAERLAERCLEMGDAPAQYSAIVGSGTYLALCLLAEVMTAQGRRDRAEELYKRTLREYPDFIGPVLPLATAMFARGATPEDVAEVVPAGKPSAMLLVGTAAYEAGHAEAGEAWFRSVLERQPANGVARIGLVETLLAQRRYDEAAAEAAHEPDDSVLVREAVGAELFAQAVAGRVAPLREALQRSQRVGLPSHDLALYRAWADVLEGGSVPLTLPGPAVATAATGLEALLRVRDVDAFGVLHGLYERIAVDPRERRELLARMYLRRGFLDSAAEEWISIAGQEPDVRAMIGLAQVAFARGLQDEAVAFAGEALRLDPASDEARRLSASLNDRYALSA